MNTLNRTLYLFVVLLLLGLNFQCPSEAYAQGLSTQEQYGLAAGHYERQEYVKAAEKFRELIQNSPSTRQAAIGHFYLGESLVQVDDFRTAYPAYQIFLKRLPNDINSKQAQFRMGECAFRLGWDGQAVSQLEKFVESFPQDPLLEYALTYLGELRIKREEPQIAMQVLDRALVNYPNSKFAGQNRFGIARSLQALGRSDEALRFYELLAYDSTNKFYGLAKLEIGKIAVSEARLSDGKDALQDAIANLSTDNRLPEAKLWLAKTELALKNYEDAFQELYEASEQVEDNDTKAAILIDAAVAASKSGRTQEALEWSAKIQNTWPKSEWADDAFQLSIELLYQQKRYDEVIETVEKFVANFDGHKSMPIVLDYKGRSEYEQKRYKDSFETFDLLVGKHAKEFGHTDKVDTWLYMKGLSQLGTEEFEAAAEVLAVVDLHDKETPFVASVLLAQASSSVGMEMPELAIDFLQQYLATGPTGASADRARSDISIAYAQSGNWEQAAQALTEFQANHADGKSYLDTNLLVAELALKAQRFDLSEQLFEQLAYSSNPREYVVRGLSGVAWVRMKRGDELSSVGIFQRLVKEHGDSSFAAEAAMACGKHFEQNKEFDKAIEMYRLVGTQFKATSFAPLARLRHAYSLYKLGGDSNLLSSESMLLSYQNHGTAFMDEAAYQLAWIYHDTKRDDKAMELFASIVDQYPDSKYWSDSAYRVAQHAVNAGDFAKVKHLTVQLGSRDVSKEIKHRILFLEGQLSVDSKDWGDVTSKMESVLAASDDAKLRRKARYWLAESYYHQEMIPKAVEELDRLMTGEELVDDRRRAWVQLRRAQCYAYQEDWTEALELSQKSKIEFKKFEADYEFDFVIGRAHAKQGRLTEARKSHRAVIESPRGKSTITAAMAQWRIGETHFHQEEYEKAIEAFNRVDSLYSYKKWRAAALVEAGKCQEHLGNWNHAAKLYQNLINKFPGSEFRHVAENRLNLATRQAQNDTGKTRK